MSDPPDSIEASDVGESLVLASADVSADAGRPWADVTLVSALLDTWRLYTYTITTSIATVYSHSLGNMYLLQVLISPLKISGKKTLKTFLLSRSGGIEEKIEPRTL